MITESIAGMSSDRMTGDSSVSGQMVGTSPEEMDTTAGLDMTRAEGRSGQIDMGSPPSCTPGDSLGVCNECGPNNTRSVPAQDDRCAPIDCSLEVSYRLDSSRDQIACLRKQAQPGPSICESEGVCHTDPTDYCSVDNATEEVVMTSGDLEECQEISACDGDAAPEVITSSGALCRDGAGVCDEMGACVLTSCDSLFNWRYNDDNELCEDQITQGYCDFLVYSEDNPWNMEEYTTCEAFCSATGGSCLRAWADINDSCRKGGPRGCGTRFEDAICRCAPAAP